MTYKYNNNSVPQTLCRYHIQPNRIYIVSFYRYKIVKTYDCEVNIVRAFTIMYGFGKKKNHEICTDTVSAKLYFERHRLFESLLRLHDLFINCPCNVLLYYHPSRSS